MRVALHKTAELRLHVGAAVVEDRAVGTNAELVVDVARDARSRGRLDVDQRHAVGRHQHGWAQIARDVGRADDLSLPGQCHQCAEQHHGGRSPRWRPRATRCFVGPLPVACRRFLHHHANPARTVEDDSIKRLVHVSFFSPGIAQRDSHARRGEQHAGPPTTASVDWDCPRASASQMSTRFNAHRFTRRVP
jgi:hypothetical protein